MTPGKGVTPSCLDYLICKMGLTRKPVLTVVSKKEATSVQSRAEGLNSGEARRGEVAGAGHRRGLMGPELYF